MSTPRQLGLAIHLRDDATFDNFVAGPNVHALDAVRCLGATKHDARIYLWGAKGCGRTHLLQAASHARTDDGRRCIYLPLGERDEIAPAMLEELEFSDLICIDDVDAVAGDPQWERALFDLYNRAAATGCGMLMAASTAPINVTWRLRDLHSRLCASLVFRLEALTDNDKMRALQQRAQQRGLELNEETARFLLRHVPRDMQSLFALLERLDVASMAEQRRLTVPFIKQVLAL